MVPAFPLTRRPIATPLSREHLHRRGHLAAGDLPRCGCGPAVLAPEPVPPSEARHATPGWVPTRHQLAGFVRAHFIYSDR